MRLLASAMLIAACAIALGPIQAHAQVQPRVEVSGVAHVIDGDTIHLSTSEAGKVVKVRLQGVAAPERSDAGGAEATRFVEQLAEGRQVRCELDGSRSKDRVVGVYYFDPQENLGRMLQSYAEDAPDGQIETLKRDGLADLFKPQSGTVYQRVLPLPALDEIKDEVRRNRVLIIVEPDSKIPPERVAAFFADLTQKNNLCVLTGDRTEMAKLDNAARLLFAVKKAERRIDASCSPKGELLLNPLLVKAPGHCVDYVIFHELCHLNEHNHSTRFYRLLSALVPDWENRKTELDELAEHILNR